MSIGGRRPIALCGWIVGAWLMLAGCAPVSAEPPGAIGLDPQANRSVATLVPLEPSSGATGLDPQPAPRSAATPEPSTTPSTAAAVVRRWRSVRSHETAPPPVRVNVPSIGVASTLQRLGRTSDGAIEVPDDWQQAGWYGEGPKPGQAGPAVILGHVDSRSGPAVFFRLRELRAGDEVHVERVDGSVVTFVVERIERHAKTRFPTHEVYLPTLTPALRLVTCGGEFDSVESSYRDNVVVFATLAQ